MTKSISVVGILLVVFSTRATRAEEKVDFAKQIQPIFLQHCAGCHGEEKGLAKLRLHKPDAIKEKWDAEPELIVAGDPEKSELYRRLVLPADDKKRMPKQADPLPKETTDLIARWIREGAAFSLSAAVTPDAPPAAGEAAAQEAPAMEKAAQPLPLPEVSAAPQEAIDKLTEAGAQVMPLFAGSNLLQVSFAHRGEPAGDGEIALLAGVAEQVHALNLAGAKPSEAGLAPLAQLQNLSILHLEHSGVTDAALAHLAGLERLEYLNLYGTQISDAGLQHLNGLEQLRRLYLWQTKASYDTAMAMEKTIPGLVVNLGYDHPMVVKARLTKEMEAVKKEAEEAQAAQAKAQEQLDAATKNAEAANTRLAELEKQLKEAEAAAASKADAAAPAAPPASEPQASVPPAAPAQ